MCTRDILRAKIEHSFLLSRTILSHTLSLETHLKIFRDTQNIKKESNHRKVKYFGYNL